MSHSLKKTGYGFFWILFSKILLQFVKIFFLIYIAKLIDPSEFGKAALVIVFYSISEGFYQFVYYNIILLEKLTQKLISSALFISFVISTAIIAFYFALNKIMQVYYDDSTYSFFGEVPSYYVFFIYLVGLSIVFKGFLFKNLYFKYIAFSNSVASIMGTGILSLLIALFFTQTYHAILIGVIAMYFLNILLPLFKEEVLLHSFEKKDINVLLKQSATITANSLVNRFATNGDYLIISKFLGVVDLGFYSKAYELVSKPVNLIGNTYKNVSFSSISKAKPDTKDISQMVYKLTYLLSLISFPVSLVIYVVSEDVIDLILGEKWIATGEIMGVLGFLIFFRIGYKKFMALIQAKEKFTLILFLQLIYAINIVLGSYILYPYGLFHISIWVVVSCAIHYFICFVATHRIFKLDSLRTLKEFLPGVLFAVLSYPIHLFAFDLLKINQYISLTISFVLVFVIFLLLEKLMPGFIKIVRIKNYLKNEY